MTDFYATYFDLPDRQFLNSRYIHALGKPTLPEVTLDEILSAYFECRVSVRSMDVAYKAQKTAFNDFEPIWRFRREDVIASTRLDWRRWSKIIRVGDQALFVKTYHSSDISTPQT